MRQLEERVRLRSFCRLLRPDARGACPTASSIGSVPANSSLWPQRGVCLLSNFHGWWTRSRMHGRSSRRRGFGPPNPDRSLLSLSKKNNEKHSQLSSTFGTQLHTKNMIQHTYTFIISFFVRRNVLRSSSARIQEFADRKVSQLIRWED